MFASYFTKGKNTADPNTLIQLGAEIGLNADEVKKMLASTNYSEEVNKDIEEAHNIGVSGVPFFVINRKYAVSGAQESTTFLEVLNKVQNNG